MDCEIPHRLEEENETFLIRVWKSLPSRRVLETVRLLAMRNGPKQTIFVSGGLSLLHSNFPLITMVNDQKSDVGVGLEYLGEKKVT